MTAKTIATTAAEAGSLIPGTRPVPLYRYASLIMLIFPSGEMSCNFPETADVCFIPFAAYNLTLSLEVPTTCPHPVIAFLCEIVLAITAESVKL